MCNSYVNTVQPRQKEFVSWQDLTSVFFQVVVCDELIGAIRFGLVDLEQVLELIRNKPERVELVLTGRNADEQLLQAADLVTEMREIKHYYQNGLPARIGIEM